jgi:uncharacterized damage-inducible protein DinB
VTSGVVGPAGTDHETPVPEGGIAGTLLGFLDYLRASVVRKVEDLSDAQARRSPVPSGTSLLGLVKHLSVAEAYWVQRRVAGLDLPEQPSDSGFALGDDDTVESVVARYRQAWARSNELLRDVPLDQPLARGRSGRTVGWALVHLVEETGRHAGHADILRELVDGAIGR